MGSNLQAHGGGGRGLRGCSPCRHARPETDRRITAPPEPAAYCRCARAKLPASPQATWPATTVRRVCGSNPILRARRAVSAIPRIQLSSPGRRMENSDGPQTTIGSGKNWKYGRHVKVNGLVRQQTLGVADLVDLIVGNRLLHARQRQRQEQGHHRAECESGLPCLPFSRLGRNPRRHHHRLRPAH